MLKVEQLQVVYGRIHAVRDVSLEVRKGEMVGLIGPNGAGKSSTLNAISGVVSPSGGEIEFQGSSIIGVPAEKIVRSGVSLVPEGRQVFTRLTVDENLIVAARTTGNKSPSAMSAVFERFPILEKLRKQPAGRLSGGEQQMLVIARALLTQPVLLMLDEPSLGLAPRIIDEVFDILSELRAEGTTIFLVEQNAAKTIEAVDRTFVMTNGTAEQLDTRKELGTSDDLLAVYLGRASEQRA